MEIWKEVEVRGYKLKVSNLGKVHIPAKTTTYTRANDARVYTATFKERILTAQKSSSGYFEVAMTHKRRRYRFMVHRLVAMAFVPGFSEDKVVNHIDGNKLNNNPTNLEWIMPGENSSHAWRTTLTNLRGERSGLAKLTEKQVMAIRRILTRGVSISSLAVVAKVSGGAILKIRDHKTWDHLDTMCRPKRTVPK